MKTELGITIESPAVSESDVHLLAGFLNGKGWVRAKEIETALGIDDRVIRAVAEFSRGAVISGQKGYRYFDRSTPIGEADHAASWMESQARKMLKRAGDIRRRIHSYAREVAA